MSLFADALIWRAPLAVVVSAGVTALLLPWAARWAVAAGAVDKPGGRRIHKTPVPRLGGVAVIAGTALACAIVMSLSGASLETIATPRIQVVLLGLFLVFAIGLLDDLRGVRPHDKLLVQTIAAIAVVQFGALPSEIVLAKGLPAVEFGGVVKLLGVLWIVGVTNAFNLIDGIDGLASVCAIVALSTMAISGIYLGEPTSFVFVASLLGALLVFLRQNWHPARIFLGDAGSMTIGFMLAVRALSSAADARGNMHVLVPLAALSYPLVDTFVAIARRWLRGHQFSRADGRHIHHQLVTIGMSVPRAVTVIATIATLVSLAGLSISFAPPQLTVTLALCFSLLSSVAAMYGIWRLGYNEFIALSKSVYSGLARSRRIVRERIRIADIAKEIKASTTRDEVEACVSRLVDQEHVWKADLVDALAIRLDLISDVRTAPVVPMLLRLEYTIRCPRLGTSLQLRVWMTSTGVAHHTTERIDTILRPELEMWFERKGAHLDERGRAVIERRSIERVAEHSRVVV